MGTEPWEERSNPRAQLALAAGLAGVGAVLVVLARGMHDGNTVAGFLLGVFLLGLGAVAMLTTGTQTITVDPRARTITVEDATRLRSTRRVVSFDEVAGLHVGYVGRRSSGVMFHYVSLALAGGGRVALFGPGRFFPGGSGRAAAERRRARLEDMLRRPVPGTDPGRTR